jgi:hypothetical protein
MVTRREVLEKLEALLAGRLGPSEVDAWALDVLKRERETYSLDGILVGEAIGMLNMLHDRDPSLRPSMTELANLRERLNGATAYQTKR